jgi:hypothetical protein
MSACSSWLTDGKTPRNSSLNTIARAVSFGGDTNGRGKPSPQEKRRSNLLSGYDQGLSESHTHRFTKSEHQASDSFDTNSLQARNISITEASPGASPGELFPKPFLDNLVCPVRICTTQHYLLDPVSDISPDLASSRGTVQRSSGALFVNICLNSTA